MTINFKHKANFNTMNKVDKDILKSMTMFKYTDDYTLYSEFCFLPDFIGFQGHFENKPIVPGICLLETIKIVLQKHLKCTVVISEIKVAKFFSPIGPSETISVKIKSEKAIIFSENDTEIIVKTEIKKHEKKAASFILKLKRFN